MSQSLTKVNSSDAGWVIDMTPEMAQSAGVTPGSHVAFYFKDGLVSAEILPPTSDSLRAEALGIAEEFADAFAQMKRRGD